MCLERVHVWHVQMTVLFCLIPITSSKYLKWYESLSTKVHSREITQRAVRENNHSCMWHTVFTLYICLPKIIKISQRVLKLLSAQASSYKVHSREINYKSSKGEQQFLNARHPLDLLYIYTIYYQNISKDIKVIERTSFPL